MTDLLPTKLALALLLLQEAIPPEAGAEARPEGWAWGWIWLVIIAAIVLFVVLAWSGTPRGRRPHGGGERPIRPT
ncbi:hypothetical protein L6R50_21030 [Myxococcota bacterium]|nr:hypothetical protein [Myxococcota bacterium]